MSEASALGQQRSRLLPLSLKSVSGRGRAEARPPIPLANVTDLATSRERSAALRLDCLHELELTALDVVQAVVSQRRVAVLVDVVLAENAVATLRVIEELLAHRLAVIGLVAGCL